MDTMIAMTAAQSEILGSNRPRLLVVGGHGAGKTEVLVEAAVRCALDGGRALLARYAMTDLTVPGGMRDRVGARLPMHPATLRADTAGSGLVALMRLSEATPLRATRWDFVGIDRVHEVPVDVLAEIGARVAPEGRVWAADELSAWGTSESAGMFNHGVLLDPAHPPLFLGVESANR